MARLRDPEGFTLLETLVALFLTGIAVLAAAPMFMHSVHVNDAGADMGSVGTIALDRMEQMLQEKFRDLDAGGNLASDVAGYHDASDPSYIVRWTIADNGTPSNTKTIRLLALSRSGQLGPRRRVELTFVRAR